jgi:23S rRNA-/tRNA-specific pseudouridylate synthase
VYLGVPHRLDRPVSGAIVFAKSAAAARRISRQFEWRRVEKTYWALVEGTVTPSEGTWTDYLKKIAGEPRAVVVDATDPAGRVAILHYRVLTVDRADGDVTGSSSRRPRRGLDEPGSFPLGSTEPENAMRPRPADETSTGIGTYAGAGTHSLLEITLETGRTHQIRVQCASRGHPLLGDALYGSCQSFGPWSADERERRIALHARKLRVWQHPLRQYVEALAPLPADWPAVTRAT